jgi:hypothetical protein
VQASGCAAARFAREGLSVPTVVTFRVGVLCPDGEIKLRARLWKIHRACFCRQRGSTAVRASLIAICTFLALAAPSVAKTTVEARGCLQVEPLSKERLECFDRIFPPRPRPAVTIRAIEDCRYMKEEDERLACYERFLESGRSTARPVTGSAQPTPLVTGPARVSGPRAQTSSSCPCGGGHVCVGPRGGRYCITAGGNKRYIGRR